MLSADLQILITIFLIFSHMQIVYSPFGKLSVYDEINITLFINYFQNCFILDTLMLLA